MRRIKRGIRKDFDKIPLKPKEHYLAVAGVDESEGRRISFNALKFAVAMVVCAVILSIGTMLTLAMNDENGETGIFESIKTLFVKEEIQRKEFPSQEFHVALDYRYDDMRSKDELYYYRSIKELVADLGDGLFYPDYEPFEQGYSQSVICQRREWNGEISHKFQISFVSEEQRAMFWIEEDYEKEAWMYDPAAERYKVCGTIFYISKYNQAIEGFFAEGNLNGNHYSFVAKDADQAKDIIDSLKKAE